MKVIWREVSRIKSRDCSDPGRELWKEKLEMQQNHDSAVCQGRRWGGCSVWVFEDCGFLEQLETERWVIQEAQGEVELAGYCG